MHVVLHELGHVLGHGHAQAGDNDDLMAEQLAAGTRRLPVGEGITDELRLDGHSAFFADLDSDLL